jgi:hypothetical protein
VILRRIFSAEKTLSLAAQLNRAAYQYGANKREEAIALLIGVRDELSAAIREISEERDEKAVRQ